MVGRLRGCPGAGGGLPLDGGPARDGLLRLRPPLLLLRRAGGGGHRAPARRASALAAWLLHGLPAGRGSAGGGLRPHHLAHPPLGRAPRAHHRDAAPPHHRRLGHGGLDAAARPRPGLGAARRGPLRPRRQADRPRHPLELRRHDGLLALDAGRAGGIRGAAPLPLPPPRRRRHRARLAGRLPPDGPLRVHRGRALRAPHRGGPLAHAPRRRGLGGGHRAHRLRPRLGAGPPHAGARPHGSALGGGGLLLRHQLALARRLGSGALRAPPCLRGRALGAQPLGGHRVRGDPGAGALRGRPGAAAGRDPLRGAGAPRSLARAGGGRSAPPALAVLQDPPRLRQLPGPDPRAARHRLRRGAARRRGARGPAARPDARPAGPEPFASWPRSPRWRSSSPGFRASPSTRRRPGGPPGSPW